MWANLRPVGTHHRECCHSKQQVDIFIQVLFYKLWNPIKGPLLMRKWIPSIQTAIITACILYLHMWQTDSVGRVLIQTQLPALQACSSRTRHFLPSRVRECSVKQKRYAALWLWKANWLKASPLSPPSNCVEMFAKVFYSVLAWHTTDTANKC